LGKKKYKLDFKPEYDFSLIGIASHQNDYRLSWALNNDLEIKLVRTKDIEIHNKKKNIKQLFSLYSFFHEDALLNYELVNNYSETGYLIPELQNIDFFLKITGEISIDQLNQLIQRLKKTEIVISVFKIDPDSLKHPEKFIFE